MWIDVVEEAISQKSSRSSSVTSTGTDAGIEKKKDDVPPSDITNKLETVLPTKPVSTRTATNNGLTGTDQNRSPEPVLSEKPPVATVIPTMATDRQQNQERDQLATRVSQRDSPPLRHRRRIRNRAQRAKTLDLSEISDVIRRRNGQFLQNN